MVRDLYELDLVEQVLASALSPPLADQAKCLQALKVILSCVDDFVDQFLWY
jgi:hypothetical protein